MITRNRTGAPTIIRDKILQKSKKTIKGYNVKDIYYGLRPKKRKTIEKMKNDDFIEL